MWQKKGDKNPKLSVKARGEMFQFLARKKRVHGVMA